MEQPAMESLVDQFSNAKRLFKPDWNRRIEAAHQLGDLGDTEAVAYLSESISPEANEDMVRSALFALGKIGGDEAANALLDIHGDDRLSNYQADVDEALVALTDRLGRNGNPVTATTYLRIREEMLTQCKDSIDAALVMIWPRLAAEDKEVLGDALSLVNVRADEGDSLSNLAATLVNVEPGQIVQLASGTHTLEERLLIEKSVILLGEGSDETSVIVSSEGCVFLVKCEGMFGCANMTIRNRASEWGALMIITAGRAYLNRCQITGNEHHGGIGLIVDRQASAEIRNCESTGCSLGIMLRGQSHSVVEDNVCKNNSDYGIAHIGWSSGIVRHNECSNNGNAGVLVKMSTDLVIEQNRCNQNGQYGICMVAQEGNVPDVIGNHCDDNGASGIYVGSSLLEKATIGRNVCNSNEVHGIEIEGGGSELNITDNECRRNTKCGITGNTHATIRGNRCGDNGTGILMYGDIEYQPQLIGNTCIRNRNHNIAFFDEIAGVADGNTCAGRSGTSNEGSNGISVSENAHPMLKNNTCEENLIGICYFNSSGGTAKNNRCVNNGHGIQVGDRASPRLISNNCSMNREVGIGFFDASAGEADDNTCTGNRIGLLAQMPARPRFGQNTVSGNSSKDIAFER